MILFWPNCVYCPNWPSAGAADREQHERSEDRKIVAVFMTIHRVKR